MNLTSGTANPAGIFSTLAVAADMATTDARMGAKRVCHEDWPGWA
jgi:hypothetical protein